MQDDEAGSHSSRAASGTGDSADVERIAEVAVSTWEAIAAALAPIIGVRGVAALFKRALHLLRPSYPWLEAAHAADEALGPADFTTLHAALLRQTGAEAAAASGALLQAFHTLLSTLIGPSLTERLLRTSHDLHSSAPPPAQDNMP